MNIQQFDYKPLDYDLFFGMDVDKKSITISVYCHEGFVKSFHTPYGSQHVCDATIEPLGRIGAAKVASRRKNDCVEQLVRPSPILLSAGVP